MVRLITGKAQQMCIRDRDEVIRIEGVISRTAFEADCDVRFYNVAGNKCAAFADFFLRGQNADNINTQIFVFQIFHGVQNSCATKTVVECFTQHDIVAFIVLEGYVWNNWCTDVDVVYFLGFFFGSGTDIDYHISDGWAGVFLCSGEEVNWCAGNNTGNPSAVIGLYLSLIHI